MDSITTTTTKIAEIVGNGIPTTKHHPKILSYTNGVQKRHQHQHQHHHHYKECLKNHAASLGGHALDGCGEFMPSPTAIPTDPTSLKCAACGCHRNFHRRDSEEGKFTQITDVHHDHHNTEVTRGRSPNSSSPPPISSSYYPSSAPHMLLALSTGGGLSGPSDGIVNPTVRKRNRTKFSRDQKEKMYMFSERLGWKMQKRDEGLIEEFCNEIGVERVVLKVWMHNNKNTYGKRSSDINGSNSDNNNNNNNNDNLISNNFNYNHQNDDSNFHVPSTTNCSSSSS